MGDCPLGAHAAIVTLAHTARMNTWKSIDSLNRTTNRNSGSHDVIRPTDVKPSSDSRSQLADQTMTPYAAPTESRFSVTAVSAITSERNVR